jgi:hypothetical protein
MVASHGHLALDSFPFGGCNTIMVRCGHVCMSEVARSCERTCSPSSTALHHPHTIPCRRRIAWDAVYAANVSAGLRVLHMRSCCLFVCVCVLWPRDLWSPAGHAARGRARHNTVGILVA